MTRYQTPSDQPEAASAADTEYEEVSPGDNMTSLMKILEVRVIAKG